MDKQDPAGLAATISWLEVEQREGKSHLGRLQQQAEQMNNMLQDHALRLQSTEDLSSGLKFQVNKLLTFEEDLRQAREKIGQLQEDLADQGKALERIERQRRADEETAREGLLRAVHDLERLNEATDKMGERSQTLESALKRQQEEAEWLRGQQEELRKSLEALATALAFSQEQSQRAQDRVEQIGLELDTLRHEDGVLLTKIEVVSHQLKQVDNRMTALGAEVQNLRDLPERLELQRVGLERLEKQVLLAHQLLEKQSQALERHSSHLRGVEGKAKGLSDQVFRLQQQVQEGRGHLEEAISELGNIQEQEKRRQIAELEHQIRNMREHMSRLMGLPAPDSDRQ